MITRYTCNFCERDDVAVEDGGALEHLRLRHTSSKGHTIFFLMVDPQRYPPDFQKGNKKGEKRWESLFSFPPFFSQEFFHLKSELRRIYLKQHKPWPANSGILV